MRSLERVDDPGRAKAEAQRSAAAVGAPDGSGWPSVPVARRRRIKQLGASDCQDHRRGPYWSLMRENEAIVRGISATRIGAGAAHDADDGDRLVRRIIAGPVTLSYFPQQERCSLLERVHCQLSYCAIRSPRNHPPTAWRRPIRTTGAINEFGHYLLRVGEYQPPSAQALQVVLMHNPKQQGVPNAVGEYRVVHHPC